MLALAEIVDSFLLGKLVESAAHRAACTREQCLFGWLRSNNLAVITAALRSWVCSIDLQAAQRARSPPLNAAGSASGSHAVQSNVDAQADSQLEAFWEPIAVDKATSIDKGIATCWQVNLRQSICFSDTAPVQLAPHWLHLLCAPAL